jgi:hypothetical protein
MKDQYTSNVTFSESETCDSPQGPPHTMPKIMLQPLLTVQRNFPQQRRPLLVKLRRIHIPPRPFKFSIPGQVTVGACIAWTSSSDVEIAILPPLLLSSESPYWTITRMGHGVDDDCKVKTIRRKAPRMCCILTTVSLLVSHRKLLIRPCSEVSLKARVRSRVPELVIDLATL